MPEGMKGPSKVGIEVRFDVCECGIRHRAGALSKKLLGRVGSQSESIQRWASGSQQILSSKPTSGAGITSA